ncbi:hypothetical protein [Stenotrophomonas sp. 22385]|uniref:hypothetical protein n=1 Tax=Stenotrophomonas sp. 22385 TaxID=3453915 RepID=UPI003F86A1F3
MTTQLAKDDRNLVGPALRTFAGLAKSWSLTELEQKALLWQPPSVYKDMLEDGDLFDLHPEVLERISYLLGIYRALHTIFPNRQQADSWIRRQHSASPFQGSTALAFMCSDRIDDLAAVRQHLEAGGSLDP